MISIALTMGYKKIYIAGLDFEPTHFKHYYDAENTIDSRTISQIKIDEFEGYIQYSLALWQFHQLREKADRFEIKIINLNKNSRVRAFEYEDK
jgi:ribosome-associated toxin RatA of RatAB toxin-antitoxin module